MVEVFIKLDLQLAVVRDNADGASWAPGFSSRAGVCDLLAVY
jgi:hypothetical protein